MKKFRILALIMTCAILLSSIMIPVSAETESTLPVAANANGKPVVIDGYRDASEGWSAEPTFTTQYKVSNPSTAFPTGVDTVVVDGNTTEARVADTNPSKLYISTDGKYIYFYYESTHSDFTNKNWMGTADGSWGTPGFYLHLAPADMSGSGATVAQQETFYLNIKAIKDDGFNAPVEMAITTNGGTYIWDHKLGDENKTENGGAYPAMMEGGKDVRASRYFVQSYRNTAKESDEGVAMADYGKAVRDDTHIAMRVEGKPGDYSKICFEIAIPINETVAEQLVNGTADYRLVAFEQTHCFEEAELVKRPKKNNDGTYSGVITKVPTNAGYVLSEKTLTDSNEKVDGITYGNWSFATNCGVKFTLPKTGAYVAPTPVAVDAAGTLTGTVTLDGVMEDAEGWENALTYNFDVSTNKSWGGGDEAARANPSILKYAHDGENLYVYYEVTDPEMFSAEAHVLAPENSGLPQSDTLYLRIVPFAGANFKTHKYTDGTFFHLRLNVGDNVADATQRGVGSIYDYTFVDRDLGNTWGLGIKTLVNQFGFYGSYDSYGDYSSDFAKNSVIALNVEKDTEGNTVKKSFEIKLPLSQTYKDRIDSGEPAFYFSAQENCYKWAGEANDNGSSIISKNGEPLYYSNTFSMNSVIPVALTSRTGNTSTVVSPVLVGFQSRDGEVAGTYDVRFVSVVEDYTGFTLENSKLGYLFNNGVKDSIQTCTKVYTELNAGNGTIKASDFGGKYFFCFTITGLSTAEDQTYQLGVSCFTQATATSAVEYCNNPVNVTISYKDGKAVFTY